MNDVVVFLILAGIALVFKWLASVSQTATPPKNQPTAPNDTPRSAPPARAPVVSEQERVRRFLEALGAPPGSAPPLPVRPRAAPLRRVVTPTPQNPQKVKRTWAQPLPGLITIPEPVEAPVFPPPAPALAPAPPTVTPRPPPIMPLVRPAAFPATAPRAALSLGELLRTADSVRQAIVLREVLGPPRGLRPFRSESFQ